jgi:MoxR-like ATPase
MTTMLHDVSGLSRQALAEVERAVVGKQDLLEMVLAAALAGGHVLLEDYPGLGKTLIARSFARVLGLEFKRIQFTPDMLPGDITGGYVFNRPENSFELRPGPIFANLILADEINRASPKTQSALLEAMQEGQVTLEGTTMSLPEPFLVLATQNPIEYEGTFPLPEAQLDRFMLKLRVGYPSVRDEREILQRRRERGQDEVELQAITTTDALLAMRAAIETVHVDSDLEGYIVAIVDETRRDRRVAVGASPRASLAFLKVARARAAMQGRDFVLPDDIKHFGIPVLSHRIILQPEHWMSRRVSTDVIEDIFSKVPVPVITSPVRVPGPSVLEAPAPIPDPPVSKLNE